MSLYSHYIEFHYAEYHYPECHYAECHFGECHHGECDYKLFYNFNSDCFAVVSYNFKYLVILTTTCISTSEAKRISFDNFCFYISGKKLQNFLHP